MKFCGRNGADQLVEAGQHSPYRCGLPGVYLVQGAGRADIGDEPPQTTIRICQPILPLRVSVGLREHGRLGVNGGRGLLIAARARLLCQMPGDALEVAHHRRQVWKDRRAQALQHCRPGAAGLGQMHNPGLVDIACRAGHGFFEPGLGQKELDDMV